MADTTKLASTFKAWRLTVGVEPGHLGVAVNRCLELGLLPEVRGYQDERVLFRVLLPEGQNSGDQKRVFIQEMNACHGALFQGVETKLICPLPSTASEERKPDHPTLLRKVATAEVKSVEKFVVDDKALKEANIGWTGGNFKKLFSGLVEEGVGDAILAVHRLEKSSQDAPIRTELNGRDVIKLAQFFELLKRQSMV